MPKPGISSDKDNCSICGITAGNSYVCKGCTSKSTNTSMDEIALLNDAIKLINDAIKLIEKGSSLNLQVAINHIKVVVAQLRHR